MMNPKTSQETFEQFVADSGAGVTELQAHQGVRLMFDFYSQVRADGCALDEDGDMLLVQWGAYDFGEGQTFQYNITRQFICSEVEDDDDEMSQLSLTFHFVPSPELVAFEDNQWCDVPENLEEFEAQIMASDAYQAIAELHPTQVTLVYGGV